MKKFFSLSAIVAVLAMLMTSVSVSSCSKDDDDAEPNPAGSSTLDSINVSEGDSIAFSNTSLAISDTLIVTAVSGSSISLDLNGNTYILGDGKTDNSYLSYIEKVYSTSSYAQALANPTKVVMAKRANEKRIISGKEAKDATIKGGAYNTTFAKINKK